MAIPEETTHNPARDLGLLILFLVIMGVIWYAQGGPQHPPESLVVQEQQLAAGTGEADLNLELSIHKEYAEIKLPAENKKTISISGWFLESWFLGRKEFFLAIPQLDGKSIVLSPGDRMLVSLAISPIGDNFRINKCMGYLSQTYDFVPGLALLCPLPSKEKWPSSFSAFCLNYLNTLPRCITPFDTPIYLGTECRDTLIEKLNYDSCISGHKKDKDFYLPEWRIYLDSAYALQLGKGKTMILRDGNGEVVVQAGY